MRICTQHPMQMLLSHKRHKSSYVRSFRRWHLLPPKSTLKCKAICMYASFCSWHACSCATYQHLFHLQHDCSVAFLKKAVEADRAEGLISLKVHPQDSKGSVVVQCWAINLDEEHLLDDVNGQHVMHLLHLDWAQCEVVQGALFGPLGWCYVLPIGWAPPLSYPMQRACPWLVGLIGLHGWYLC